MNSVCTMYDLVFLVVGSKPQTFVSPELFQFFPLTHWPTPGRLSTDFMCSCAAF
jgi:hypothetical protein